jgi:hypothetical protein
MKLNITSSSVSEVADGCTELTLYKQKDGTLFGAEESDPYCADYSTVNIKIRKIIHNGELYNYVINDPILDSAIDNHAQEIDKLLHRLNKLAHEKQCAMERLDKAMIEHKQQIDYIANMNIFKLVWKRFLFRKQKRG